MADLYKSVCQWCGQPGERRYGTSTGGTPSCAPSVPGNCKSHPSGKPNMPHAPKWEKA